MLVFLKENLVFLSVPKTGSTAYEQALQDRADMVVSNPPELKHAPVYRYNRWFRPMFAKVCNAEPEVMAVMREPISWLGSWYKFRQRSLLDGRETSTKGISFDQFVRDYCRGQQPAYAAVGSQVKFLEPQPNGCRVSHLFRYEDPANLHSFLEERLNVRIQPPQVNVSPVADLTLSAEVEAILRRKKSDEFALYDSLM